MNFLTIFGVLSAQINIAEYAVDVPWYFVILASALVAFPVTYVVIPSITNFSRVKNLFDTPNERTSHTSAVPTLGGAAVFIGMILPTTLFGDLGFDHDFKFIIAGLLILFFAGIKDDILIISARTKLGAELLAIFIVVFLGNIRITDFHGFLGIHELTYLASILFTMFMLVVVINGFNLIDGIDGLASGVGILSLSGLGVWFIISDDLSYAAFCFSTVAALVAFFRYNVFSKTNKIFLGDTGSLIIGMVVALFTIRFLEGSLTSSPGSLLVSAPAIAIGLLIVPLMDTLRVFTMRIALGKSPFEADRNHMHHKLLDLGLNHLHATLLILGYNLVILGMALAFRGLGNIKMLMIILPLAAFLSSVPGMIYRYRREQASSKLKIKSARPNGWIVPDTLLYLVNTRILLHNELALDTGRAEKDSSKGKTDYRISDEREYVEADVEIYPD